MMPLASALVAAGAAVILVLGSLHLLYTFRGTKLHARDAQLMAAMKEVHPVITRQTTMWRAWIGFNATHSFGAIIFGVVYGYLAVAHGAFLFQSAFLMGFGLLVLAGYVVVGRLYFFSVPFRGIVLATALYAAGMTVGYAAL